MTREQLEHVIRAAAAIADAPDIVVIGSQAVLGGFPGAPPELLVSMEADVYPLRHPERGELIDGSIGEGSPFERSFGYYAHGVDATTAILPQGWEERLVLVTGENTHHARGWCLEVHDLAIAKYAAGREKDLDYTRALAKHRMTRRDILLGRLAVTPLGDQRRGLAKRRVDADFSLAMVRSESMAGQGANTDPNIDACVEELKSKIPFADYAALESRLQALINDPDADDSDVISILRREFDTEQA